MARSVSRHRCGRSTIISKSVAATRINHHTGGAQDGHRDCPAVARVDAVGEAARLDVDGEEDHGDRREVDDQLRTERRVRRL